MKYRGEGKYIRQSSSADSYGHCILEIEPLSPGAGVVFENVTDSAIIPAEFVPGVEQGVRDEVRETGLPFVDMRVRLVGGSWHEVDSHLRAFRNAGTIALRNAKPIVEP